MINDPLKDARESYSNEWEMTSNFFKNNGYYDWCAANVNEHSKVLEIGIGIGNGSVSLLKRGCKITGIEENYYNIDKTITLLKSLKIPFGAILREDQVIMQNGKYNIEYLDIDITQEENEQVPIIILQGDFILDEVLKQWLFKNEKYDAVVCWFTGIHGIIYRHSLHSVENPTEYRMLLHDFIFQFAPYLLKPKAVINICDRFRHSDKETEEALFNELRRVYKFQERNLEIKSINKIVVSGIDTPDGVQHATLSGREDEGKNVIYSIDIALRESQ